MTALHASPTPIPNVRAVYFGAQLVGVVHRVPGGWMADGSDKRIRPTLEDAAYAAAEAMKEEA